MLRLLGAVFNEIGLRAGAGIDANPIENRYVKFKIS